MDKYCCFNCPKGDYALKSYEDKCPICDLPYGFPLFSHAPKVIGEFKVLKSLDRGFYGATYVVEKKSLIKTKKLVLKVVPVAVYKFFNKDFIEECRIHADVAEGTQHIVNIEEVFDIDIDFNSIIIPCHVAILDYLEGNTLKNIFESSKPIKASAIGQIAIDLLKVLTELHNKKHFHNDLHPGNIIIENVKSENKRIGEVDENIKAVAIDFGSLGQKSQSGDKSNRVGDLHWVAQTLNILSQKILDNPDNAEERDYRLASLLEERARILFPRVTSQRVYEFDEVITQIRNAFVQVDSPWRQTLSLRNFKDSYNAQTLAPWFVPSLLVDDDDKWISEISNKGPQVVTGMRGCGKTMLIRALQFHARAIPRNSQEIDDNKNILTRLQQERYIGLYVSCTRLLDKLGDEQQSLHEPFTRLFVAYALEAINALRHLRELDRSNIRINAFSILAETISNLIEGTQKLRGLENEHEIERYLKDILNSLSKGESKFTINSNPANTFPQLAHSICQCSTIWQNQYVFFLLDDVSTRFLNDKNIISLVSSLLFQNENCSFKFTTEAQTLEMVIHSPGNIEQAMIGRDYSVFDLGYEVNKKVHSNKREGIAFVEKILFKRAKFHSSHPKGLRPVEVLGDTSLQAIAENIARVSKASEKKGLYHGITAIAGVCVGDIGDVITLYEMILKRRTGNNTVSPGDQNECYLDLCNSRLYDINRRESRLFDFAESFAEAAHYLLLQSYKQYKNSDKKRLRQYSSIFINITSGDIEKQNRQVRELIDAGIFNFSGGPQASRTNRQGVNPQQQFKLTYRKLYGVIKHIGLAQTDRFELSGEPLEEWLNNPKEGKDILIRNLKNASDTREIDGLDQDEKIDVNTQEQYYQKSLFDELPVENVEESEYFDEIEVIEELAKSKTPTSTVVDMSEIQTYKILELMAGLGFEDCTLESFNRLRNLNPEKIDLIKFSEEGKSSEILALTDNMKAETIQMSIEEALNYTMSSNHALLDITGFPQSIIFSTIRKALIKFNMVYFACTEADQYYPLDEDIDKLLQEHEGNDQTLFLESLKNILRGEIGPYQKVPLLEKETNSSSRRVLIAFSSAKHERLFSLLDEREYDKIHIIVPKGDSPRNKLAKIAAEVAVRKFNHAEISEFESDSLQDIMEYLSVQYQNYFVNQNFSFELALTGSKLQTVASAAICAQYKVNQCWYLQPEKWDASKFTHGVGKTKLFKITK